MNPRSLLRSSGALIAGAATGALSAGAVVAATTSNVADPAPAAERSIASMFEEWFAIHHRDSPRDETDEESDAFYERYIELQNAIIKAEPRTPRDLAMMAYADNGGGTCDFSDEFGDRLLAMALEGRAA